MWSGKCRSVHFFYCPFPKAGTLRLVQGRVLSAGLFSSMLPDLQHELGFLNRRVEGGESTEHSSSSPKAQLHLIPARPGIGVELQVQGTWLPQERSLQRCPHSLPAIPGLAQGPNQGWGPKNLSENTNRLMQLLFKTLSGSPAPSRSSPKPQPVVCSSLRPITFCIML